MSDQPTAVVTGASRGFGRAIAAALVAAGHAVDRHRPRRAGPARRARRARRRLHPARRRRHRRGARAGRAPRPPSRPARAQRRGARRTWRRSTSRRGRPSAATGTPTPGTPSPGPGRRCGSRWRRAAWSSRCPAAPSLAGSPLSGGYASAKAAVRYLRGYAADESSGRGWASGSSRCSPSSPRRAASARSGSRATPRAQGVDRDTFVDGLQPVLTAEQVAKAVLELAADPAPAAEYQLSGAGLRLGSAGRRRP